MNYRIISLYDSKIYFSGGSFYDSLRINSLDRYGPERFKKINNKKNLDIWECGKKFTKVNFGYQDYFGFFTKDINDNFLTLLGKTLIVMDLDFELISKGIEAGKFNLELIGDNNSLVFQLSGVAKIDGMYIIEIPKNFGRVFKVQFSGQTDRLVFELRSIFFRGC
jgi:hypothetical protein